MKHQVNLYTDQLRPPRDPFPFKLALTLIAVIAAGGLLVMAACHWLAYAAEAELAVQQQHNRQLVEQLAADTVALQQRRPPAALAARAESLGRDVSARERLLAVLGDAEPLKQPPFVNLLDGLARQANNQLWLTRIGVTDGQLLVNGNALREEAVAGWLGQLINDPELTQLRVSRLEVTAAASGGYQFVMEGQP